MAGSKPRHLADFARAQTPGGRRRAVVAFLRHHAGRLFLLALPINLLFFFTEYLTVALPVGAANLGLSDHVTGVVWRIGVLILGLLVRGPIYYGYCVVVDGAMRGVKVKARALLVAYRSPRLLASLVVVVLVSTHLFRGLSLLCDLLPWQFDWSSSSSLIAPDSLLMRCLSQVPPLPNSPNRLYYWLRLLVLMPLGWAAFEVILGGRPAARALGNSLRLSFRHPGFLAAACLALVVFVRVGWLVHGGWMSVTYHYYSWALPLYVLRDVGGETLWLMLSALVFVGLYRAMLRREHPLPASHDS